FGPVATDLPREPHEPPRRMLIPSAILVLTCLLVGVIPSLTFGPFLHTAAGAILGAEMPQYDLAVWHGFNLPLIMSLVATGMGVIFVLIINRFYRNRQGRTPLLTRADGRPCRLARFQPAPDLESGRTGHGCDLRADPQPLLQKSPGPHAFAAPCRWPTVLRTGHGVSGRGSQLGGRQAVFATPATPNLADY